jgi:hypothetical protein
MKCRKKGPGQELPGAEIIGKLPKANRCRVKTASSHHDLDFVRLSVTEHGYEAEGQSPPGENRFIPSRS